MQKDFPHYDDPEKLREENEFLKMKLMLEHGAELGGNENNDLPPEIEHQFLANVLAFEKQYEQRKTITIFEKIERPTHFKPAAEISDEDIGQAWKELLAYLNKYGIDLDACSTNVTSRELYHFTLEELFKHEMDDISLPGWVTHFIYDEFHPDPIYENSRTAVDDCINMIFCKEPLEWMHIYTENNIRLNGHYPLNRAGLQAIINRFKESYTEISLTGNENIGCTIEGNRCTVKGNYSVELHIENEMSCLRGIWNVFFEKNEDLEYWDINEIQIEGISF